MESRAIRIQTISISSEDVRILVETATLAGTVIGSGQLISQKSRSEENISDRQEASHGSFPKEAQDPDAQIQFALPLPEVLSLVVPRLESQDPIMAAHLMCAAADETEQLGNLLEAKR